MTRGLGGRQRRADGYTSGAYRSGGAAIDEGSNGDCGLLVLVLASCSTSSEPTATYAGGACDYDGPSEFDLDSTVTFTVTNESDATDMGFSVWSVPEGTTADEILEDGIFTVVGGGPPVDEANGFYAALFRPTAIGTSEGLRVFLDTPGQHALNCFDGSTDGDHAIMFTVNG